MRPDSDHAFALAANRSFAMRTAMRFAFGVVAAATCLRELPALADGQVEAALRLVQAKAAKGVLDYAESKRGTKVSGGYGSDLVSEALNAANADFGSGATNEKGAARAKPQMGCLIKFKDCTFKAPDSVKSPDGNTWVFRQNDHAIVKSAKGTSVVLLYQSHNNKPGVVRETTLDLAWLTEGAYELCLVAPSAPIGYFICSPVDWTRINLDGGTSKETLVNLLKKHGFETQYRGVDGKGGSIRLELFARLTKETKTPFFRDNRQEDGGVGRNMKLLTILAYGGRSAEGKQVRFVK
jgi:hypothetical protein